MAKEFYPHKFGQTYLESDLAQLIDILDGQSALDEYKRYKKRSIELLGLCAGMHSLDVGCGLGAETHAMATLVAPYGQAVGIDSSAAFIDIAIERTPKGNLASFKIGDGCHIDFESSSFDAVRIDRVLQHTPDPFNFISEANRVLKDGGRCVVVEPDWETFVINHPHRISTRKIMNNWCDKYQNPWIGRGLAGMFKRAGFFDINVEGVTLIYPTLEIFFELFQFSEFAEENLSDCRSWIEALKNIERDGEFFASVEMFMVYGKKAV